MRRNNQWAPGGKVHDSLALAGSLRSALCREAAEYGFFVLRSFAVERVKGGVLDWGMAADSNSGRASGVPFEEIEFPADGTRLGELRDWSAEDLEVLGFLRFNFFSLANRLKDVEKMIKELKAKVEKRSVPCAACGGELEEAQG